MTKCSFLQPKFSNGQAEQDRSPYLRMGTTKAPGQSLLSRNKVSPHAGQRDEFYFHTISFTIYKCHATILDQLFPLNKCIQFLLCPPILPQSHSTQGWGINFPKGIPECKILLHNSSSLIHPSNKIFVTTRLPGKFLQPSYYIKDLIL